jgi:hypothetical protein
MDTGAIFLGMKGGEGGAVQLTLLNVENKNGGYICFH